MQILKILSIVTILTLAATSYAAAASDSIGTAIGLLSAFDSEESALLRTISKDEEVKAHKISSEEAFNETFAELKTLRWSEKPSRKRFNRVYNVYLEYANGRINALNALSGELSGTEKTTVDTAILTLTETKKKALKELSEISAKSGQREERLKASPIIDRSRYEDHPGDSKGLYER